MHESTSHFPTCNAPGSTVQIEAPSAPWQVYGKQELLLRQRLISKLLCCGLQNVKPEKLFSRQRAVEQLLGIIDSMTMDKSGSYIAWDGQSIPF